MPLSRALVWMVLALGALVPALGLAAASPWTDAEKSKWRWISAQSAAGDASELELGLEVILEPGWKIYWRTPGEAGLPPQIFLTPEATVENLELSWPAPVRFQTLDIDTIGYEDAVIFPARVSVPEPGLSQKLATEVQFLICEEICIPGQASLSLDLAAGTSQRTFEADFIQAAYDLVPDQGQRYDLALVSASLEAAGEKIELTLEVAGKQAFSDKLDAFVEAGPDWNFSAPEVRLNSGRQKATLSLIGSTFFTDIGVPSLADLSATLVDGDRSIEILGASLAEARVVTPTQARGFGLIAAMIGFALLGGLILNLMPCVLPVLSLKVLSLVKAQDKTKSQARLSFSATAAGIVFSFLVLAGGAIGLKLAGVSVGWGTQFQQPIFLAFMVALVSLFALNLFGLFEFGLPWGSNYMARAGGSGLTGDFATGAFATLLATPCSAPFIGPALGFAFGQGPVEILVIFFFMGLGMGLPYIAIAVFPATAKILPKPGPWMVWVKYIMGLALVATAVWLLSVVLGQLNVLAVGLMALIIAATLILLVFRLAPRSWALTPLAALVVVPMFFVSSATPIQALNSGYEPLDLRQIQSAVNGGQSVFVDVTAQWCVTCIVNKQTVLDTPTMRQAFEQQGVLMQQADWTKPNDDILAYLQSFARVGIPFNVVYGPGAPNGIPLPEILTRQAVLTALDQAS